MTPKNEKLMNEIIREAMKTGEVSGETHDPYITVYLPIAGWKAVMYWWNPEGFWGPWETSPFAFVSEQAAEDFGREWAEEEGIEFCPRSKE